MDMLQVYGQYVYFSPTWNFIHKVFGERQTNPRRVFHDKSLPPLLPAALPSNIEVPDMFTSAYLDEIAPVKGEVQICESCFGEKNCFERKTKDSALTPLNEKDKDMWAKIPCFIKTKLFGSLLNAIILTRNTNYK